MATGSITLERAVRFYLMGALPLNFKAVAD